MSNLKITDLSSLSQSTLDAAADFLLVVDVSDTTMSVSGTNVKISPKSLVGGSLSDLVQTWNNGATAFTGFKLNITDTASDANSSLMDLQVAGSSKFRVKKDGTLYVNGSAFSTDGYLPLSGGTVTGQLINNIGTITSSQPFEIRQTWNNAAVDFLGLYVRATDTASASTSYIAIFGTSTTDFWSFRKDGAIVSRGSTTNTGLYWVTSTGLAIRSPGNGRGIVVDGWAQSITIDSLSSGVQWNSGTPLVPSADSFEIRRSTNAQTLRIYGTYTDGSNYRRLLLTSTTGGVFSIIADGAGTGANGNSIKFDLVTVNYLTMGNNLNSFSRKIKVEEDTGGGSGEAGAQINCYNNSGGNGASGIRIYGSNGSYVNSGCIAVFGSRVSSFVYQDTLRIVGGSSNGAIQFGGYTSSEPMIKRSGTKVQSRLADDSAFATHQAKLMTDTNYTAGAPTATGYLVLYDAAGTAYRVPAVAN